MGHSALPFAFRHRTSSKYLISWSHLQCEHWLYMCVKPDLQLRPLLQIQLHYQASAEWTNCSISDGLGYLKILAPPEKVLRWIEGKLNLLGRLPHYVSIDQKTYGRYGILPT